MPPYERPLLSTLLARLNEPPAHLLFPIGPRQTGKTTLVRQALARLDRPFLYLPVDSPESEAVGSSSGPVADPAGAPEAEAAASGGQRDARWLTRQWQRARVLAARSECGFVLVFDEIQTIPGWSATVKGLWDADRWRDRRLRVVLLGSAALLVREGMNASLAGRFETLRVTQWPFPEMAAAFGFDLPRYIWFGGYPGAAQFAGDEQRWRDFVTDAIAGPTVEQDALAARRIDKPALLRRLFEMAADYSGQVLSWTKMAGHLQDAGNTATLARYLHLLEGAGLVAGLPNYAGGGYRWRAASPKPNVLDTALMSALSGRSFEEALSDRPFWGRLVESAVGAHLFKAGAPLRPSRLHYWRRNGHEVDFVLGGGRRCAAFEVKSGAHPRPARGLDEFARHFDAARRIVVGEGGVSLAEFFSTPAAEWLAAGR